MKDDFSGSSPLLHTSRDSLTVYIFLEDECVISQYFTTELNRLYQEYHSRHIGFVGYFPSSASGPDQMLHFADSFRIAFPLLPDYDKNWTRRFGITITPEVAVWDHRTERQIYRGRIDDSFARVGKRRLHPQHHDLEEMISGWMAHQVPEEMVVTQAVGCFISK